MKPILSIDRDYLFKTLAELVRIDSTNPSCTRNGAGEAQIAAYVSALFSGIGLEVSTHEPQSGRVSMVGRLKGKGGGRSLMLNAHSDTVGVEGMSEPFSADLRNGRLYGRGAQDMKGSLAACMAATKALVDADIYLSGDLLVAAVADEEFASLGTADVIQHYQVDGAIVTEPTDMAICLAHKGFIWLEVETHGRAAHGSRYEDGIDANLHMGRVMSELDKMGQALATRQPHPLVGHPSLHVARISGGTEWSIYAASCKLQIERRTIPGESEADILADMQTILDRLSAADPNFRATMRSVMVRQPYAIPVEAPVVVALREAASRVLGQAPPLSGVSFWTDAALLGAAGVETVLMGPVGAGLHSVEEWVDLESVAELAHVLAQAACLYCG